MPTRILPCRDAAHVATEAAHLLLGHLASNPVPHPALALSGGRIAPLFFHAFANHAPRHSVDPRMVHYFWADERCVPPDHADSNFAVARQTLLDPLSVPADCIHRLEGERDPEDAARRAVVDWHRWQASRPKHRTALDAIALGVGEDGHVASLFPGNLTADLASEDPFRAVVGPKPPPRRVTMGYPLLWDAGLVVVLVTGPGKDAIVEGSLAGSLDTPFGRVLEGRTSRGRETVLLRQM